MSPQKRDNFERKVVFQPSSFRGHVSIRGCNLDSQLTSAHFSTQNSLKHGRGLCFCFIDVYRSMQKIHLKRCGQMARSVVNVWCIVLSRSPLRWTRPPKPGTGRRPHHKLPPKRQRFLRQSYNGLTVLFFSVETGKRGKMIYDPKRIHFLLGGSCSMMFWNIFCL